MPVEMLALFIPIIGIILGVDRILDMTRTMVNVGSDVVTTVVVDRYTKLDEAQGRAA